MKKLSLLFMISAMGLLLSSCAGIKYLTVETREPAQVTLPANVRSIIVVNNTVEQPKDVGHSVQRVGRSETSRTSASSDSIAIFYTEALSQFLEEEKFFDKVLYYGEPLRTDADFFQERPIDPASMNEIRNKTGVDAILSLDKLIMQTDMRELYQQQGYVYGSMSGKVHSIIRVYLPTMEGRIPAVRYTDSLHWEGFNIQDGRAYAELMLPSREEAMKQLAVHAAEKMTYVFSPHWVMQDRWYYTLSSSLTREAEAFAGKSQWNDAIGKWQAYYNTQKNDNNKAKVAHNIAMSYEMLGDMEKAYEWATIANDLFVKSTANNSLERKRSLLYKNEIQRRVSNNNSLDMQTN